MTLEVITIDWMSPFLSKCKNFFAYKHDADAITDDIDTHLLNVDYSNLEFDTSELV